MDNTLTCNHLHKQDMCIHINFLALLGKLLPAILLLMMLNRTVSRSDCQNIELIAKRTLWSTCMDLASNSSDMHLDVVH